MSTHTTEVQTLPLTLGEQFRAARKRTGLEQDEIGPLLDPTRSPPYNRTTISRWENDKAIPPFTVVAALSEMSGWDLELFARAKTPNGPATPPGLGIASRRCSVLTLRPRIVEQEPLAA